MMTDGQIKPQRSGNISEWNFTRNTDPIFYVCPNQNMFCECNFESKSYHCCGTVLNNM